MRKIEMYNKIRNDICRTGAFGLYRGACAPVLYGTDLYSEGIKRMCELSTEFAQLTSDIAKRYYENDPGTAYNMYDSYEQKLYERHVACGRMAGSYQTDYGKICISSDGFQTTMFFDFEW